MSIAVGNNTVQVDVSKNDAGVTMRCKGSGPDEEALAEVVNTGWALGPKRLLEGVRDRVGFDFEGRVGVAYAYEVPDELDPDSDQVKLYYLDRELTFPEADYAKLVGRVVQAATEDDLAALLPNGPELRALAAEVLTRSGRSREK
jgi:hypothetical protein